MITTIIAGIIRDLGRSGTATRTKNSLPVTSFEWRALARVAGRKLGATVVTTETSTTVIATIETVQAPPCEEQDSSHAAVDVEAVPQLSDPSIVEEGDRVVVVGRQIGRENVMVGRVTRSGPRLHVGDVTVWNDESGPNLMVRVIAREPAARDEPYSFHDNRRTA